MFQHRFKSDGVVLFAHGKGKPHARGGESLKSDVRQHACRSDVPGIWNQKRLPPLVQRLKRASLFCLHNHDESFRANVRLVASRFNLPDLTNPCRKR